MNDPLELLRQNCPGEEFDYSFLMSHLQDYTKPRDKVTRYLKNQEIIRVKKGLYIFGERFRQSLVSLEILANLIYGPSYLSLEYALAFYGFIPEKVEWLTCVTTQKNKLFRTPIGIFTYFHLHPQKYSIGIVQYQLDAKRHFLIASKEKALADLLARQEPFKNKKEILEFFIDNLRIDEAQLWQLNRRHLQEIAHVYSNSSVNLFNQLIQERT